jgi:hypothetical protein
MLIPIQWLLLAFFAFVIGHILLRFARSIRATVSDDKLGKTVHGETSIGVFDLRPQPSKDPLLASIPVYPGAAPLESEPPEYEAGIRVLGRGFRMFAAKYWTSTAVDVVWEFYRRELPDWEENHKSTYSREYVHHEPGCTRKVQVYSRDGRTLINTAAWGKRAAAVAAGAGISSDSSYSVLRQVPLQ